MTIKDYFNINHLFMDSIFPKIHVTLEDIIKCSKIDQNLKRVKHDTEI